MMCLRSIPRESARKVEMKAVGDKVTTTQSGGLRYLQVPSSFDTAMRWTDGAEKADGSRLEPVLPCIAVLMIGHVVSVADGRSSVSSPLSVPKIPGTGSKHAYDTGESARPARSACPFDPVLRRWRRHAGGWDWANYEKACRIQKRGEIRLPSVSLKPKAHYKECESKAVVCGTLQCRSTDPKESLVVPSCEYLQCLAPSLARLTRCSGIVPPVKADLPFGKHGVWPTSTGTCTVARAEATTKSEVWLTLGPASNLRRPTPQRRKADVLSGKWPPCTEVTKSEAAKRRGFRKSSGKEPLTKAYVSKAPAHLRWSQARNSGAVSSNFSLWERDSYCTSASSWVSFFGTRKLLHTCTRCQQGECWSHGGKGGKGKGGGGKGGVLQAVMKMISGKGGKGGGKGKKGGFRVKEKVENRVWIGGLPEIEDREERFEAGQKLLQLLTKKAGECKMAKIWHTGQGVATFASEEEAQSAISACAGIKFRGKVLEFDTWEKQAAE